MKKDNKSNTYKSTIFKINKTLMNKFGNNSSHNRLYIFSIIKWKKLKLKM